MRENRITTFDIKICLAQRQNLKFCVVSPGDFGDGDSLDIAQKIGIFTAYHLAIRPEVPVILFELESLVNTGSPLYKHDERTRVYHLPPNLYPTLEENLKETEFLLSHTLLKNIIETDKVYSSILDCLSAVHETDGLNVLGVFNETKET